ncbi:hypothetical protein K0M31_018195 [Melipona bicolor]|uniref:Uncharacterized protein n=1 Tax=Melipona bicolor TaxID=60889 RepID=A0AA40FDS1_9HYME|nr:hypothetical protein K0M31_018195 [Melipona bicolor]
MERMWPTQKNNWLNLKKEMIKVCNRTTTIEAFLVDRRKKSPDKGINCTDRLCTSPDKTVRCDRDGGALESLLAIADPASPAILNALVRSSDSHSGSYVQQ